MSAPTGRAMGLDVGERRVGVAIADELDTIASPLTVVLRRPGDLEEIRDLAVRHGVDRLVLGMPTGMSGREGPQAASVRVFAAELRAALVSGIEIAFWDERLTTTVAERVLRERSSRRNRRKGEIDAMAAAVILQGYLDAGRARRQREARQGGADSL
ncbi:MAG: Holliday junction resolvase RuvX [Thermomicrobiales bacterium]|nr:Holliday junction resolvase RuvX [Thermomicrobiales bacterium]